MSDNPADAVVAAAVQNVQPPVPDPNERRLMARDTEVPECTRVAPNGTEVPIVRRTLPSQSAVRDTLTPCVACLLVTWGRTQVTSRAKVPESTERH